MHVAPMCSIVASTFSSLPPPVHGKPWKPMATFGDNMGILASLPVLLLAAGAVVVVAVAVVVVAVSAVLAVVDGGCWRFEAGLTLAGRSAFGPLDEKQHELTHATSTFERSSTCSPKSQARSADTSQNPIHERGQKPLLFCRPHDLQLRG